MVPPRTLVILRADKIEEIDAKRMEKMADLREKGQQSRHTKSVLEAI